MSGSRDALSFTARAHPALIGAVDDRGMPLRLETGFADTDAAAAFARVHRRQSLATLASQLRMKPVPGLGMLSFHEVVATVGRLAEHDVGYKRSLWNRSSARSAGGQTSSTACFALGRAACKPGGRGLRHASEGTRCPRSTCTASAICISFGTAITASRSPALTAIRRSRPTSGSCGREMSAVWHWPPLLIALSCKRASVRATSQDPTNDWTGRCALKFTPMTFRKHRK